ncbi:MAG: MBL fold metallo-hydrolase [Burkholderiaceae bacterium]|nr:MBL fold metallo-hydrolase [Burkholderiaceae bacterium]
MTRPAPMPAPAHDTETDEPPPPAALHYPLGDPPASGEAREVRPGVLWLRMPLPFALNHINLWALDDGDGWAVVDTGTQTPEVLAAWRTLLAPTGALRGRPVTRVIATHMHPDHMGMAGWLTRKYDARLWMTREEYLMCRTLAADTGREAPDDAIRFYRRCGWPDEALDTYRARFGGFGKYMHALPDSYRRIVDGETLAIGEHAWRVTVGRGHSPEHACLVCDDLGLMISGDQVLPRISSNVSVFPTEPDADPLREWLTSIDTLRGTLPDSLLVLPAHGEPFTGLHARLDRLAAGHAKALQRLRRSLIEPRRVMDLFGALFARPIDAASEVLGLATGETVAHLNHLRERGELSMTVGADGAWRFQLDS